MAKLISRKEAFERCPALMKEVFYWQKSEYDDWEEDDFEGWDIEDKHKYEKSCDLLGIMEFDDARNGITVACSGFNKDYAKVNHGKLIANITEFLLALENSDWCFVTGTDMNWLYAEKLFRGKRNGVIKDIKSLGVGTQTKDAICVTHEELLTMVRFSYGHVTGTSSKPDIYFSAIGSPISYHISKHGLIWMLCFDEQSLVKVQKMMPEFGCFETDIHGNPIS